MFMMLCIKSVIREREVILGVIYKEDLEKRDESRFFAEMGYVKRREVNLDVIDSKRRILGKEMNHDAM